MARQNHTPTVLFQSTLPMQGVTVCHSDLAVVFGFQSTLPMQGVTLGIHWGDRRAQFQSTLPMQGVTRADRPLLYGKVVSIHTPYAGSDTAGARSSMSPSGFNPHSLCRE